MPLKSINIHTNKNIIPWVTFAKFLGLYLMILGHMQLVSSEWGGFIYTFHMPLFFVLSGMLHKDSDDKKIFFKNVFRKLIIPFLLIALIWCIVYMVLWIKNGNWDSAMWSSYLLGTFISPGKPFLCLNTLRRPLWFLLALAEIKIIASFVRKPLAMVVVSIVCVIAILILSPGSILSFILPSKYTPTCGFLSPFGGSTSISTISSADRIIDLVSSV